MMRIERMVFGISGMVIKLRVLKLEVEVERVVHDNFDVAFCKGRLLPILFLRF